MYMYIWVTLKGAESPQKKTDSCPCYRHVQSASQYLLSPLPAKTQICLDIDPSVKPKSKWSGWAQPLTSGCRKEKERGSHLLGAPIKVSSVPLIGLARFGTEKITGSHCQCALLPCEIWEASQWMEKSEAESPDGEKCILVTALEPLNQALPKASLHGELLH